MRREWRSGGRVVATLILTGAGFAIALGAPLAPAWTLLALASTAWPLIRASKGSRGTALRAAVAWAALSVGLGMVAQVAGLREDVESGRPGAGHWAYLSALCTLATLISVLNARRPGGGAWALLMGLLVLVFLIPWLEGSGLVRGGGGWSRLRLETPWTLFFLLLTIAGVTNYLPTRYGFAAAWAGLSLAFIYLGMTREGWSLEARGACWTAGPWAIAVALWVSEWRSAAVAGRPGVERLWFWFRDRWGVVWALRALERFNRTAEAADWPIRLTWHGLATAPGQPELVEPHDAEATLMTLLRRFADRDRLARAAGR